MATPQPLTTPAPEVPGDVMARIIEEAETMHLDGPITEWPRQFARTAANRAAAWAWAQREEEVRAVEQRGADAELEACCEWLNSRHSTTWSSLLRAARRPSPPALRERALAALGTLGQPPLGVGVHLSHADLALIREALKEGADS